MPEKIKVFHINADNKIMSDGKIDGKFVINQGGITQGIAAELGLTKEECNKIGKSIWTQIIQEFDNPENIDIQNNNGQKANKDNNYLVHKNAVVTFTQECWTKIVSLVNKSLGKNIQIEESQDTAGSEEISGIEELTAEEISRKEEHEKIVKQAVELLKQNWELSGLGKHLKTPEDKALFLKCLDEVVYNAKESGAGYSENGIIHIQTNNNTVNSKTEMLKLLIHEANHAYLQRKALQEGTLNYPTKAEEAECETLALNATANLVKAGKLESYEIYGHPVEYYDTEAKVHNTAGFQDWLQGYNKLAENLNGDINIRHHTNSNTALPAGTIELADNDNIIINGQSYLISQAGKLISGSDSGRKENITSDCTIKSHGKIYKLSVQDRTLTEIKDNNMIAVKGGSTLSIQDYPPITIGKDAMLEGVENTCVTQLIIHHKDFSSPTLLGTIIFDDMQPTDEELAILNNPQFDKNNAVPFTITQADGTEIKGICYPNRDELENLN